MQVATTINRIGAHETSLTVTATPGDDSSMLPLSSNARERMLIGPLPVGIHLKLHASRPWAGRHVTPSFTEISTPATRQSMSLAAPVIWIV